MVGLSGNNCDFFGHGGIDDDFREEIEALARDPERRIIPDERPAVEEDGEEVSIEFEVVSEEECVEQDREAPELVG